MAKTVSALLPFLVVILGHPGLGAVTAIADPSSCDVLTTAIASNQEAIQLLLQDASGGAQRAEELQSLKSELTSLKKEVSQQASSFNVYFTGECPPNWLEYGSSCYLLDNTTRTWEESRMYCIVHSGHLVKITDEAEQKYLAAILTFDAWIGLHNVNGSFLWTDGTIANYTPWGLGPLRGDCTHMMLPPLYLWYHDACFSTHGLVCERSVPHVG